MKKRIDFVTLSPLLLLTLLLVSNWFAPYFTQTATHPGIVILKYFSIPLIGFSLGFVLFLGIVRDGWELPTRVSSYLEQNAKLIILLLACTFLLYLSALAVLRYTSLHTLVFDMGTYDRKIWRISTDPLSAIPLEVSLGHFQPILIFHALIYKVAALPIIIQVLQAVATISGIIPLYLLAKKHLHKPMLVLLMVIIYLLYPPVGFNAALDFHPDHLCIPLWLWSFYFIEEDNYWKGIVFVGLGAMAKEPLILGTAFFGLYLTLAKKRYLIGTAVFIIFILIFFVVVFSILPYTNQIHPLEGGAFPFVDATLNESSVKFDLLMDTLLMWNVRKFLFVYFLLAPLLFLPLLEWKRFLPAVPLIAIPFMSTVYLHSSVDSQYTAGIIAPVIVAFIFSLKRLEERFGPKYTQAFAVFALVMTLTFNTAHGPSPWSINFWREGWSEIWHKSAFTKVERDKILRKAIYRIPADPAITVISQGNINHARLAHRYSHWAFPYRWENADYIILDTKRPPMIGDQVDQETYHKELNRIKNNPKFKLEFEQDGVLLFRRDVTQTFKNLTR